MTWKCQCLRSHAGSAFLVDLSDVAARILIDAFEQCPSAITCITLDCLRGQVTRVDPTATAFAHREPGYNLLLLTHWVDPPTSGANSAWTPETFDALEPYLADRRYMKYVSADDTGFVRQAHGANSDRPVHIKHR